MTEQNALAASDRFIERYGLLSEEDGLPRTAGRLMAMMILEAGPFSFSELAERLRVSRGSISTNTRLLEQLGVIERITRPGDRQDYFQLGVDPWSRILEAWIHRQLKKEKVVEEVLGEHPDLPPDARQRVETMLAFIRRSLAHAAAAVDGLREDGN